MNQPDILSIIIHVKPDYCDPDVYTFHAFSCDMSEYGYVPMSVVEVATPRFSNNDIKARQLLLLRRERDVIYEKARAAAADLDERIAKLEAIGYTPYVEELDA